MTARKIVGGSGTRDASFEAPEIPGDIEPVAREQAAQGINLGPGLKGRAGSVGTGRRSLAAGPGLSILARDVERAVRDMIRTGRRARPDEEAALAELMTRRGRGQVPVWDPADLGEPVILDGTLSFERLRGGEGGGLLALQHTLKAMSAATSVRPQVKSFGAYALPVQNPRLGRLMKPAYSPTQFEALFSLARSKGVFQIPIDSVTGIGRTTQISESEDDIMSQFWVTDSVRLGDVERDQDPNGWRRALVTLAHFYEKERPFFEEVFARPEAYRDPSLRVGVHHMFDADYVRYPWLSPKRIESHGLALEAFAQALRAGLEGRAPWGLEDGSEPVVEALAYLARYLADIDYSTAPSNGVWEELVFADGLTWDIEAARRGFVALRELLATPALVETERGRAMAARLSASVAGTLCTEASELDRLIARGEEAVRARATASPPIETRGRGADASLVFVASSTIRLADDPMEDARARFALLRYLEEKLVLDLGMVKYEPFDVALEDGTVARAWDGYLAPNWGLAATAQGELAYLDEAYAARFGHTLAHLEPSTPNNFVARSRLAPQGKEAQWFLVAEMANGYARIIEVILDAADAEHRALGSEERELLSAALSKQTEYINRGYARVTGSGEDGEILVKANGRPCPPWAVPEAFQHVTTLKEVPPGEPRKTALLPCVNTPLSWAAAVLYQVSRTFERTLARVAGSEI